MSRGVKLVLFAGLVLAVLVGYIVIRSVVYVNQVVQCVEVFDNGAGSMAYITASGKGATAYCEQAVRDAANSAGTTTLVASVPSGSGLICEHTTGDLTLRVYASSDPSESRATCAEPWFQ